jgi:hypothetical protein
MLRDSARNVRAHRGLPKASFQYDNVSLLALSCYGRSNSKSEGTTLECYRKQSTSLFGMGANRECL